MKEDLIGIFALGHLFSNRLLFSLTLVKFTRHLSTSSTYVLRDVIAQEWIPLIIRKQSTAHASVLTSEQILAFARYCTQKSAASPTARQQYKGTSGSWSTPIFAFTARMGKSKVMSVIDLSKTIHLRYFTFRHCFLCCFLPHVTLRQRPLLAYSLNYPYALNKES